MPRAVFCTPHNGGRGPTACTPYLGSLVQLASIDILPAHSRWSEYVFVTRRVTRPFGMNELPPPARRGMAVISGPERIRTADLTRARGALYQLSYRPEGLQVYCPQRFLKCEACSSSAARKEF